MTTREEGYKIVTQYVKNTGLINHMLSVEAAMRYYAGKLGGDVETWGLAGLLHDFDWEIHPSLDEHPSAGAPLLRDKNVPEEIVHAVLSHGEGVARINTMEKCLAAVDELTGLITAVALVRPSRSLYDLTASSVKKKWKDRAFAAAINREEIAENTAVFGEELWQHVDNVIYAMRNIAPQLELEGSLNPDGTPR
ncbi:MAG: HDIG domain-containing protein [Leptolinea sp.]|jgi:putative nucleotidyltransferase with HDIG domain|nr:HDIG domain-containing protein [Leptolinea sp.]